MLNRTFAYTDTTRQPVATATRRAPYLVIENVPRSIQRQRVLTRLEDVNSRL